MANEFKHSDIGTQLTKAEWEGVGTHVLASQSTGDIIYASSSSQLTRLGIGSTGQVLKVTGGVPAWGTDTTNVQASALTGTTMAANVVASSLTSVGTLTDLTVSGTSTTIGTVTSGIWQGTAIASAYLDADTAHLSGTQTFSGAKTFSAATAFSAAVTVTQTAVPHYQLSGNWTVATGVSNPFIANVSGVGMTLGTYKFNVITNAASSTDVDFSIDHNGHAKFHKSPSGASYTYLDGNAGQNSRLIFLENGTAKWNFGTIGSDDSFTVYNQTTSNSLLTFTAADGVSLAGTLGIGRVATNTGSFGVKLDVYGDSPIVRISNTAEDDAGILFDDSDDPTNQNYQILYHSSNQDLTFRSDETDNVLVLEANGNIGLGRNDASWKFDLYKIIGTGSLDNADYIAANILADNHSNSIINTTAFGLYIKNDWRGLNTGGTFTNSEAVGAKIVIDSSWGVLPNAYGIQLQAEVYDSQTITNYYGLYVLAPTLGSGAVLTNKYGVYVADASFDNYFAGDVGVGTTSPHYSFHTHTSGNSYFHATNSNTGAAAADGIVMGMGAASSPYIWSYENSTFYFGNNGAQAFHINASQDTSFNNNNIYDVGSANAHWTDGGLNVDGDISVHADSQNVILKKGYVQFTDDPSPPSLPAAGYTKIWAESVRDALAVSTADGVAYLSPVRIYMEPESGTGDTSIEMGKGRDGNANTYIDFIGDATYTDYGTRLIRYNTGANTDTSLEHRGTGTLNLKAIDTGGKIELETGGSVRMHLESAGNMRIYGDYTYLQNDNAILGFRLNTLSSTGGVGLRWLFNTDTSNFASLTLDYDNRGVHGEGLKMYTTNGYTMTLNAGSDIALQTDNVSRFIVRNDGSTETVSTAKFLSGSNIYLYSAMDQIRFYADGSHAYFLMSKLSDDRAVAIYSPHNSMSWLSWWSSHADDRGRFYNIYGTANTADGAKRSMIVEEVVSCTNITAYATILTLTPSTVTNVWTQGLVYFEVVGHTSSLDNGTSRGTWYFNIANAAPGVGTAGGDQVTSSNGPAFRLDVSGNDIRMQVQSGNGTNRFDGTLYVRVMCPQGAGSSGTSVTYTLN